jgi:HSP20 family protein
MFDLIPWKKKTKGNGTAVMPYREFEPVARMREEFDRLFDNFFRGWPRLWEGGRDAAWGFDVEEKDDKIVVRAEAPGFEPDDFDLQVRGNQLVLRAERKAESEQENFRSFERREFYRALTLPAGTDPNKVDARYKNGVLTVTLPKTEKATGKRIAIKA